MAAAVSSSTRIPSVVEPRGAAAHEVEVDHVVEAGRVDAAHGVDVAADRAVGEAQRHDRRELGQRRAVALATSLEKPAKPSDFTT